MTYVSTLGAYWNEYGTIILEISLLQVIQTYWPLISNSCKCQWKFKLSDQLKKVLMFTTWMIIYQWVKYENPICESCFISVHVYIVYKT